MDTMLDLGYTKGYTGMGYSSIVSTKKDIKYNNSI